MSPRCLRIGLLSRQTWLVSTPHTRPVCPGWYPRYYWVSREGYEDTLPERRPFNQAEFDEFCADPKTQALIARVMESLDS